jgi:hypothetical protein
MPGNFPVIFRRPALQRMSEEGWDHKQGTLRIRFGQVFSSALKEGFGRFVANTTTLRILLSEMNRFMKGMR